MKIVGHCAQETSLSRLLVVLCALGCGPAASPAPPTTPVEEDVRRAHDADNDGVPDDHDACPNVPGEPDTGCPRKNELACSARTKCVRVGETVGFARGSAALQSGEEATLTRVARWLNATQEVRAVEVRGFARDTGGGKRELLVASERAARVCTWLVAHGVEAKRLVPRGFSNWPDEQLPSGVAFEVLDPNQDGCCE
jgi:outer membrane protein OmpA-like peptidoglycan-associated protein